MRPGIHLASATSVRTYGGGLLKSTLWFTSVTSDVPPLRHLGGGTSELTSVSSDVPRDKVLTHLFCGTSELKTLCGHTNFRDFWCSLTRVQVDIINTTTSLLKIQARGSIQLDALNPYLREF